MIPISIQKKLDELAEEAGRKLLQDVTRVFEKYARSGALADSPKLSITRATDVAAPKIIITYLDQGFFIGQRSPQWTRLPNVGKLTDWSDEVQFTGPVPGYKNGIAPNLPPWKIKQRQIFAIAKSKHKFDTHKRKAWKKEAKLGDFLKELNSTTIEAFSLQVEKILNAALEGSSTS